jgi:hypothetical protein
VDADGRPFLGAWVHMFPCFPPRRVPVDDQGRFAISGESSTSPVHVMAGAPGLPDSERVAVHHGDDEVTLVLRAGGTLAGQVLLAEGIPPAALRVEIQPNTAIEPHGRGGWPQSFSVGPQGAFTSEPCVPGSARARICLRSEVLWSSDAVPVRAGEVTGLQPIDLREVVRLISVQVTDENGAPIPRGGVTQLDAEGDWMDSLELGRTGRIALVASQPYVDLRIDAPGFRRLTTSARDGDQITMQRR